MTVMCQNRTCLSRPVPVDVADRRQLLTQRALVAGLLLDLPGAPRPRRARPVRPCPWAGSSRRSGAGARRAPRCPARRRAPAGHDAARGADEAACARHSQPAAAGVAPRPTRPGMRLGRAPPSRARSRRACRARTPPPGCTRARSSPSHASATTASWCSPSTSWTRASATREVRRRPSRSPGSRARPRSGTAWRGSAPRAARRRRAPAPRSGRPRARSRRHVGSHRVGERVDRPACRRVGVSRGRGDGVVQRAVQAARSARSRNARSRSARADVVIGFEAADRAPAPRRLRRRAAGRRVSASRSRSTSMSRTAPSSAPSQRSSPRSRCAQPGSTNSWSVREIGAQAAGRDAGLVHRLRVALGPERRLVGVEPGDRRREGRVARPRRRAGARASATIRLSTLRAFVRAIGEVLQRDLRLDARHQREPSTTCRRLRGSTRARRRRS